MTPRRSVFTGGGVVWCAPRPRPDINQSGSGLSLSGGWLDRSADSKFIRMHSPTENLAVVLSTVD
jgi:hypothetical protein